MLRVAEHFEKTDTGRQRRSNEDSFFARSPLFVVADGMGGARAGEVASRMAVEAFEQGLPDGPSADEALTTTIQGANERIYDLAGADRERAGMGTTLTAAYVGPHEVTIAHVGDSRAYRVRDGQLERLTIDHSLVGELVRRGKLTEEQAEEHPQRSVITRALGPERAVDVDIRTYPARHGDLVLLCSDGLTGMVGDDRLAEILTESRSLRDAGRTLIDEANENGGRDNITVVLFRVEDIDGEGDGETDAPTTVHSAEEVEHARRAALARSPTAPGDAGTATAAAPAARARRQPRPPAARTKRRRWRGIGVAVVALALIGVVLVAGWMATRAVYFVGSDDGFVAVYRGLPYDLPFGIKLYEEFYVSGVTTAELPAARRRTLLDHELRTKEDASDLVRQVELGQIREAP